MYYYRSKDNPCYQCTDRHMHCHSECDAYKDFCARNEERRQQGKIIRSTNEALYESSMRRYKGFYQKRPATKAGRYDEHQGSSRLIR